jgi:hypothetical protein
MTNDSRNRFNPVLMRRNSFENMNEMPSNNVPIKVISKEMRH